MFVYPSTTGSGAQITAQTEDSVEVSNGIAVGENPYRIAINSAGTRAYVANSDGSVTIIDTSDYSIINTVQALEIDESAYDIVITPDDAFVYVCGSPNSLARITTSDNSLDTYPLPNVNNFYLAVNSDGTRLAISAFNAGVVNIVDTSDHSVDSVTMGSGADSSYPRKPVFTPDDLFLYVPNSGEDEVEVIDMSNNTITDTIAVGNGPASHPFGLIAISPDGNFVYTPNYDAGTVSVINTSTNVVDDTVTVGASPVMILVTPDNAFAYVLNRNGNSVSVIDTSDNSVLTTIPVGTGGGNNPEAMVMNNAGTFIYVSTDVPGGAVDVISIGSNTVTDTVPEFGALTYPPAITPDDGFVYFLNATENVVQVLDTSDNTIAQSSTGGGSIFATYETVGDHKKITLDIVNLDLSGPYTFNFAVPFVSVASLTINSTTMTLDEPTLTSIDLTATTDDSGVIVIEGR